MNNLNQGYTEEQIQMANKKAEEKISFLHQLIVYIVINAFLFLINFLTDRSFYWCFFVAFFWGLGLIMQGLSIFLFDGVFKNMKESLMQSELKKIKK